ncbi:MAG: tRNA (adenosine(37)-N6)-threonylcarbamoyltransferase complex dimerization subunit type 1 TsaB [Sulfobacillus sp.]
MKILGIDASGPTLAVGLVLDQMVAADFMWIRPRTAGSHLVPWIEQIVNEFGRPDAIACGIGPGSFTGVRIAVTAAKALAYAWNIPVKGVSSLQAWAMQIPLGHRALITTELRGSAFYAGYYQAARPQPTPLMPDMAVNGSLPDAFPSDTALYVVGPLSETSAGLGMAGPLARPLTIALLGSSVALLARTALIEGYSDTAETLAPFYGRPPAITVATPGTE